MAKLYSKNSVKNSNTLNPKEETLNFLLDYSKALRVVKHENKIFELLIN